jgi:FAD dependent oxidoreductase TIGR03364
LEEFAERASSLGVPCQLLSAAEVHDRTPAANPDRLWGGLFSPTELCVNPRRALPGVTRWLSEHLQVGFEFNAPVCSADENRVVIADGRVLPCDRLVVCSGADFETLFPQRLAESGLRRCKLQMLKTRPLRFQPDWGPHLASGLTLRHYANFEVCRSLEALKRRVAEETPELDRYGIHVMASRNDAGEVVLGDSHEYDRRIEPFDKMVIDDLILRELRKLIRLPDWTIAERWHGVYAKHPSQPLFEAAPAPGIRICTGTGGAGMTMAFGLAERTWQRWETGT